jgi:hypothetical protein
LIEKSEDQSQFLWASRNIEEVEKTTELVEDHSVRNNMIAKWHELIADTLNLLANDEPLTSKSNRELALHYHELDESQQTLSVNQNFIIFENIAPNRQMNGSFNALRDSVCNHLEAVLEANKDLINQDGQS